jgi:hypothetical protein
MSFTTANTEITEESKLLESLTGCLELRDVLSVFTSTIRLLRVPSLRGEPLND